MSSSSNTPVSLREESLLGSLGTIWARSAALCALVPAVRVCTGRIPSTEEYEMPYVSILPGSGSSAGRTDKTRMASLAVTFKIWVKESQVSEGEAIEAALEDAYCDRSWPYKYGRVLDCLDQGPGIKVQADRPEYRAWEINKIVVVKLERRRRPLCRRGASSGSGTSSASSTSTSSASESSSGSQP